jgi:hypothetical protein
VFYVQDSRIENSIANANFIEKIIHFHFYQLNIRKHVDALSRRGEFFDKFYESDDGSIINCRALMMRIMAVVCHIPFEIFEQYKEQFKETSLLSVHKMKTLCNSVNMSSVLESYPPDIFLRNKISNDIFLSDDMEHFAASLFVELKMSIFPEQVFLNLFL